MTELAADTITITPDKTCYVVMTLEDAHGAGTMWPYALATAVDISDGRLTVLAGDDALDVYEAGEWAFAGPVQFSDGEGMPQRDGRVVICRGQ